MKKFLIITLFISLSILSQEKKDSGVTLVDETKLDKKIENKKNNEKKEKIKNDIKDKDNTKTKKDNKKENSLKNLKLTEEEFVFNSKYCKFDSSLSKSLELGIQMGSPFGIDARFWVTDFLGFSSIVGITSDLHFYLNADITLSLIKLYSSKTLDLRLDFSVGGFFKTDKKNGDTIFVGGILFPVALSLPFKENPINISLYYAPGVNIIQKHGYAHRWGIILNYNLGTANKIRENNKCLYKKVKEFDKDIFYLKKEDKKIKEKNSKLNVDNKKLETKNLILNQEVKEKNLEAKRMKESFRVITNENIKLSKEIENLKLAKGKLNVDLVVLKEEKAQLLKDKKYLEKEKNSVIGNRKELEKEKDELNKKLNEFEKHKKSIAELIEDYNKKENLKISSICILNKSKDMSFEAGIYAGFLPGANLRFWFNNFFGISSTIKIDFPELDEKLNFLFDLDLLSQFTVIEGKNMGFALDLGIKMSSETKDFSNMGLYLPLGFSIPFYNSPIEVSTYFAPGINFKDDPDFDFKWGITFNYNFMRANKLEKHNKCMSKNIKKLALRVEDLKSKNAKLVKGNLWLRQQDEKLRGQEDKLKLNLEKEKTEKSKLNEALKNVKLEQESLKKKMQKLEQEKSSVSSEYEKLSDFKKRKEEYQELEFRLQKEKQELENKLKLEQEEKQKFENKLKENKETINQFKELKCQNSGGIYNNNICTCKKSMKLSNDICVCSKNNMIFNQRAKRCVCKTGFTKKKGKCIRCSLVNYFGECVTECFKPEVPWKGKCVCPESKNFTRDIKTGSCVCKKGYNPMGDLCIDGIK